MTDAVVGPETAPAPPASTPPAAGSEKTSLWSRIAANPVVLKELRGRMRGGRAFIILTLYLLVTGGIISLIYLGIYLSSLNSMSVGPDLRRSVGKAMFFAVAGMELMMICFIAPALTAGSIAAERERQTYDLLRTTLLSARSLVFGKLVSSLGYIWLLLFAGLPLLSLAYLFGGISIEEVAIAILMMLVTSLFFSAMGLFYSSFMKRTLGPTVLSYATALVIVFGLPMLILMILLLYSSFGYNPGQPSWRTTLELILYIGGWLIVTVNPLGTAFVTELILSDNQSFLYTNITMTGGASLFILSPWIAYLVFYLLFSAVLVLLSIHFVKRVET
jgi:ABC-type transport system involved in multi-copper enzyme maturation permease subunit